MRKMKDKKSERYRLDGAKQRDRHSEEKDTHCSALMYCSSTGLQATLPMRTPVWMSLNCRPRFSPVMVNMVPPCLGPVSGNSCRVEQRETEEKGEEKATPQ